MNFRILVLAFGTFAIGTGTFIVTGLLGGVAGALSVSVSAAGHLVTVFAAAYALGSPVLVALAGSVGRRRLLVASLVLFAGANLAAAVAPTFSLLLAARVLAACGAAVCTPVSGAVAADLADPEKTGRALSVVLGGLSVSWVLGIPLGSVVADTLGWRASFVLVAVLATVAALMVRALLPDVESPPEAGFWSRLAVAKQGAVLVALGVTALGVMAGFVVLTYVRPLLEGLTNFGGGGIGLLLLLFGLASVLGTALGGYAADRFGYRRNIAVILPAVALSLLAFSLLPALGPGSAYVILGTGAALFVWSVFGFALIPLQQYRVVRISPKNQNEVLSLNASAIYLGQGSGAALGSLALTYGSLNTLGWTGALCAATSLTLLALATLATSAKPHDRNSA